MNYRETYDNMLFRLWRRVGLSENYSYGLADELNVLQEKDYDKLRLWRLCDLETNNREVGYDIVAGDVAGWSFRDAGIFWDKSKL